MKLSVSLITLLSGAHTGAASARPARIRSSQNQHESSQQTEDMDIYLGLAPDEDNHRKLQSMSISMPMSMPPEPVNPIIEPVPENPIEPLPENPIEPVPENPPEPVPENPIEPVPENPIEPTPGDETTGSAEPEPPVEPDNPFFAKSVKTSKASTTSSKSKTLKDHPMAKVAKSVNDAKAEKLSVAKSTKAKSAKSKASGSGSAKAGKLFKESMP